jgi:UDP-N-acetylmuramate-alanine ligase
MINEQKPIIGTEKGTFYLIELACELAEKFIQLKYQYSTINIYNSDEFEEFSYTEEIQDEFNSIYDEIETYLQNNKL